MSIKVQSSGQTLNIESIYVGGTKIGSAYIGSTLIYSSQPAEYPYLLIWFDNASYTPSTNLLYTPFRSICTWSQQSSSPNVWKLEIHDWNLDNFSLYGLSYLFRPNGDSGANSLTMTCSLVGSGNMDTKLNGHYCQTFDRMFYGATGLTSIEPIHCTRVQNVGSMFQGCTNVEQGALDQYTWLSTYGVNITNHSGTFTDCGSGTTTGAAELAQIPVGWGGTQVPASTLMTSTRGEWKGRFDVWSINSNAPDWTYMNGLYLFTESSVSSYAGVAMNRARIAKFNGLKTTQGQAALYFYPCFMQHDSSGITWAVTTGTPNGSLTASQRGTDMPGTLDYGTYGPFAKEFGYYSSAGTVYFCFFVTNEELTSWGQWDISWKPYGVLFNSNFKTDGGFRWFK